MSPVLSVESLSDSHGEYEVRDNARAETRFDSSTGMTSAVPWLVWPEEARCRRADHRSIGSLVAEGQRGRRVEPEISSPLTSGSTTTSRRIQRAFYLSLVLRCKTAVS